MPEAVDHPKNECCRHRVKPFLEWRKREAAPAWFFLERSAEQSQGAAFGLGSPLHDSTQKFPSPSAALGDGGDYESGGKGSGE